MEGTSQTQLVQPSCSHRATQNHLPRTMSGWLLTLSLGNLCLGTATPGVKKFSWYWEGISCGLVCAHCSLVLGKNYQKKPISAFEPSLQTPAHPEQILSGTAWTDPDVPGEMPWSLYRPCSPSLGSLQPVCIPVSAEEELGHSTAGEGWPGLRRKQGSEISPQCSPAHCWLLLSSDPLWALPRISECRELLPSSCRTLPLPPDEFHQPIPPPCWHSPGGQHDPLVPPTVPQFCVTGKSESSALCPIPQLLHEAAGPNSALHWPPDW